MNLKIFFPGGTSHGVLSDDASDDYIYDVMYTAATKEQGNGKQSRRTIADLEREES